MSAQLSQHQAMRLLIAEQSESNAYEIESNLRDAGIATRLTLTDDLAHISQLLADGEIDIALVTSRLKNLQQLLPRLRENAQSVPIIVLLRPEEDGSAAPLTIAEALRLGATDAVAADQQEQLALVVKRELDHVCDHEHFLQIRRALNEAEQRCQLLLQGSKDAIAYIHEGMHIHANEHYLKLFGYNDPDDLGAVSLVDLIDGDSATTLKQQLKQLRNGAEESTFEFNSHPDGPVTVHGNMQLSNSRYEGEPCLQVTITQNITAPAQAEGGPAGDPQENSAAESAAAAENGNGGQTSNGQAAELELPGFVRTVDALFASHSGSRVVLVMALDNIIETQRAYGLLGTDTICRQVWHALSEMAQDTPLARLGAHQFAAGLATKDLDQARSLADTWRTQIGEMMFEVHGKTVRPTISIGGTEVVAEDDVAKSLDEALANLMDLAENGEANKLTIPAINAFDEDTEGQDAKHVLHQITEAIEKKNFLLLFQPIISLRGDSDEHYEVFLRMTDPDGNQVEPGKFLQTAINNNVAGKIDRWVILQSIKMLSVHRAKGHTTRLTINLTSNSVADPEFLQWLTVAIKAARLPSDAVIFQITEKDAVTYLRQTREFIEGLRAMHCRASLSRFGLIDDPFETLRHLPVDMVKLDGTFISGIDTDAEKSETMIDTVKRLQGSGKLTVVPMVENANILSTLWQAGVNYIQGHYLQEPTTQMDYDFSTED